jgi:hypothetical protein
MCGLIPSERFSRISSSSASRPVKWRLRVGISFDQMRCASFGAWSARPTIPAAEIPLSPVPVSPSLRGAAALPRVGSAPACSFSARQAACHSTRNRSRSSAPPSALTTCSRKAHRGTRELRKMLCTVEELILPRPARIAISRIDGRPAWECRLSRRSKRSAIGPGGTGSRLIDPTPCHPPWPNYVQVRPAMECVHAQDLRVQAITYLSPVCKAVHGSQSPHAGHPNETALDEA